MGKILILHRFLNYCNSVWSDTLLNMIGELFSTIFSATHGGSDDIFSKLLAEALKNKLPGNP